jgi:enoyl-CoA hydratase/carnithine racemase
MNASFTELSVTVDQGVAVLTLNRPDQRNALNVRLVDELNAALAQIANAGQARALILTATGEQAFSAGVDLKERRGMSAEQRWAHNRALNDVCEQLAHSQTPTIAALNGLALGGGFELALACDFRIAAEHAQVGLPEVSLGIVPGAGGTQRLPRLIGPTRAKELILTARRAAAAEALAIGLLNQVTPPERLLAAAHDLARQIARNSPLAVAYAKAAIDHGLEMSLEQGLRYETAAIRATLAADDYQIALAAFAEKRAPEFPPLNIRRLI